jgi:nucleoside-diphosphate-sugar epimerase
VKRVLITGGAGFIGLHLARHLLKKGCQVDLLDDFSRGRRDSDLDDIRRDKRIGIIEQDLLDHAAVEGLGHDYTEIFHFAAMLGVSNVIEHPFAVLDVNTRLTLNAIALARRQTGLKRFVFASTSEVYVGTLENFDLPIPTPESVALALPHLGRPRTSYMLSKLYGEALSLHSGLPMTIIRPHNVYGPRMGLSHVIPQLLERGFKTPAGGTLDVYSVDHTRTFCYIDDAVEMIERVVTAESANGKTVNVGTQAPEISIGRLAEIVVKVLGKPLVLAPQPATQGSPVRRAPEMTVCAKLTGYRSLTSLEEGVKRTFAWYRDHVFLRN